MPNLSEEQEKIAAELTKRPMVPTLQDAVELCKLENTSSVQRLFELHEVLLSRWHERRDNIMHWW